jgi:hypothetical protein
MNLDSYAVNSELERTVSDLGGQPALGMAFRRRGFESPRVHTPGSTNVMSQDIEDRFPKEVVPPPAEIDLAVPELGGSGQWTRSEPPEVSQADGIVQERPLRSGFTEGA